MMCRSTSTLLVYTGLSGGLEHLKIETRLIDERYTSVMGECENVTVKVHRLLKESRAAEVELVTVGLH